MRYNIVYGTRTLLSGETRVVPAYYLDGVRVTKRQFTAGKKPDVRKVGGRLVKPPRRVSGYPKVSEALAVSARQVEEAQARADRHGVSVQYTPRGDVIVPDRGNWLKLLKLEGCVEKS